MTTDIAVLDGKKPFTDEELQVFEKKYMTVMKSLADMTVEKKRLEEAEKKVKGQLEKVMDEYSIKSISNQYLTISRVPENKGKTTIDVAKMEKEEPDLYADLLKDYPKTTGQKKAYVLFKVK